MDDVKQELKGADEPQAAEAKAKPKKGKKPSPCGKDNAAGGDITAPYSLPGLQVDPSSAYWTSGPSLIHVVHIDYVRFKYTENPSSPLFLKDTVDFPRTKAAVDAEIATLADLAAKRHQPLDLTKVSDFIQLQSAPFEAIFNTRKNRPQYRVNDVHELPQRIALPKQVVLTGAELARLFESETPGLYHQHALQWLLANRPDIGPTRRARIWMALYVTIYSALCAAWWYKWASPQYRFRLRPYEYDRGKSFQVLYDDLVDGDGDEGEDQGGGPRDCPCPSPGTPRHPAWPSGHSTFSAAASHVLQYFFQEDKYAVDQLGLLADNIGRARLWAGVHYESDHLAGQKIGKAVAESVIDQLRADCVPPIPRKTCQEGQADVPPDPDQLALETLLLRYGGKCDPKHDNVPPRALADRGLQFRRSFGTF